MKTLMIGIENASLDHLPADESVTNLRWLMQIGCYGTLEETCRPNDRAVAAVCDQITSAGKRVQVIHKPLNVANTADTPDSVGTSAEIESHISSASGERAAVWQALDAELGAVLGTLDEETAVLVILTDQAHTGFILVVSDSPLHGEVRGVHLADLARTLLEMDASQVPGDMPGRSLVAGRSNNVVEETGYTEEEEEVIRERLTGLGYIG